MRLRSTLGTRASTLVEGDVEGPGGTWTDQSQGVDCILLKGLQPGRRWQLPSDGGTWQNRPKSLVILVKPA